MTVQNKAFEPDLILTRIIKKDETSSTPDSGQILILYRFVLLTRYLT